MIVKLNILEIFFHRIQLLSDWEILDIVVKKMSNNL